MGLTVYILGVNFIAFLLFGMDEKNVPNSRNGVSERTLMLSAAAGAWERSLGCIIFTIKPVSPNFVSVSLFC